ncbi:hypothetical protein KY289_028148 [Solanum tuberosum]|nr:hypothetical protein KY289_028148 [Solanum tuberosum]KAH0663015.1 hypothetical protein KY284_027946 [Solanum tuberosum]
MGLSAKVRSFRLSDFHPHEICMITRRDNPDGSLWRLALEGFSCILLDDIRKLTRNAGPELTITRPARMRIWKEVADIFEIFLIGNCGRALSVMVDSADESLEMNLLNILGDKILKSQIDAPLEIMERLINTLDRCASRTCSLPLETIELMPSHCSRFSLTCLQKLFLLCSQGTGEWNSTRCEVSNISIKILISRCEFILEREARVRELVQQLLRYVTTELGLPKSSLTVGS